MNIQKERLEAAMKHKKRMEDISDQLDLSVGKLKELTKNRNDSDEWKKEWAFYFGKECAQSALVKIQYKASKLIIDQNRIFDIIEECMPKEDKEDKLLSQSDAKTLVCFAEMLKNNRDENGNYRLEEMVLGGDV